MLFVGAAIVYVTLALIAAGRASSFRLLAAFLIAPLVPSIIIASAALDWHLLLVVSPFSYTFALIGFPAYFLLRWLGWLRPWQLVPVAAVAGAVVAFVAGFTHFGSGGSVVSGSNTLLFAGYGAVTGLVFWFIAFNRRAA